MTSEVQRGSAEAALRFEIEPHNCFACGELNEHGLQLRMHLADRGSWTELTLPRQFEGWDGIAHGGDCRHQAGDELGSCLWVIQVEA